MHSYFCDLFLSLEINYFTNYAVDTTPYVIGKNLKGKVVFKLKVTQMLLTWLAQNKMKASFSKYDMLLSTTETYNLKLSVNRVFKKRQISSAVT